MMNVISTTKLYITRGRLSHNESFIYLHAITKCAEVTNLSTKDQVAKLSICEENNEEHDGKTSNIFSTLKWKINYNWLHFKLLQPISLIELNV